LILNETLTVDSLIGALLTLAGLILSQWDSLRVKSHK